jgi:hypothetical protein
VATTGNVADLATGAPDPVDGVSLAVDDRVLVLAQGTGSQNGLYRVVTVGTGSDGVWTRVEDYDQDAEVRSGDLVFVQQGSQSGLHHLATVDPIQVGVTSLSFLPVGEVQGSGTANHIAYFSASDTITSEAAGELYWDPTNNILAVGTTTPEVGTKLHISQNTANTHVYISSHGATVANQGILNLVRSRGTQASPSVVSNGDALGSIRWNGQDTTNYARAAKIDVVATGAPTVNNVPADMLFFTSDGTTGAAEGTERMRITSAGNVAIGTLLAAAKLDVDGSAIFNKSGVDVNFTVEGVGTPNALFVQGSDGAIGINSATPGSQSFAQLDIRKSHANTNDIRGTLGLFRDVSGGVGANGIGNEISFFNENSAGGGVYSGQFVNVLDDADATPNSSFIFSVMVNGVGPTSTAAAAGATERLRLGWDEVVFNRGSADVDFRVESDAETHTLFVEASSGNIGVGTATPGTHRLLASHPTLDASILASAPTTTKFAQVASAADTSFIAMRAYGSVYGGVITNWATVESHVGNGIKVRVNAAGQVLHLGSYESGAGTQVDRISLSDSLAVFNEDGYDYDFRFEGDTDANLLFLDASTDRVGIGTATPAATYKLEVIGNVQFNENKNSEERLYVVNSNAGNAAVASVSAASNGAQMTMASYSTTKLFSHYGIALADSTRLISLNAANMIIGTNTSGSLHLGTLDTNAAPAITIDTAHNVTVNPGGENYDFIVEGDTDTNLLHVDASADAVGISTATPASTLDVAGSFGAAIETVTDDTLDATNHFVVVNTTASARTINLPAVSGLAGRGYFIRNNGTAGNDVTIDASTTETINGALTHILTDGQSVHVVCNGTEWFTF